MKNAIIKKPVGSYEVPAFEKNKNKNKKKTLQSMILVFFLFFNVFFPLKQGRAVEFDKYDQLIEYAENTKTQTVFYKYTTTEEPQKIDNEWNEDYTKRQSDKEFYVNPNTNEKKVKIYSGDNYFKKDDKWFQVEIASTTEKIFFDNLELLIEPATLFDKMISFFDFFPVIAQEEVFTHSADGIVGKYQEATWTSARDTADGDTLQNTQNYAQLLDELNTTYSVWRASYPFNTNGVAVFNSAHLYIYELSSNADTSDLVLVQSNPASPTALANGDFDTIGTVNNPDEGSGRFSGQSIGVYIDFELNSTGLSWIDDTGYTVFGLRGANDVDNVTPTGRSYRQFTTSETAGTDTDPYLELFYIEEEEPEATTTPTYSVPCDMEYNTDISIISSCQEIYAGSTTPSETTYSYFYLPVIQYFYIYSLFLFLLVLIIIYLLYINGPKKTK